jgi:chromosome segregation ATPase
MSAIDLLKDFAYGNHILARSRFKRAAKDVLCLLDTSTKDKQYLQKVYDTCKAERDKAEKDLKEAQKRIESVKLLDNMETQENIELRSKCRELEEVNASHNQVINNYEIMIDKLEKLNDKLQAERDAANAKYQELVGHLNKLLDSLPLPTKE